MAINHIWHGRKQSSHHDKMATTLISDQVGTHPLITSEWPCTHIWSCESTSHSNIRMAPSPRLSFPGNWPGTSIQRMAIALIYDHVGTNTTVTSKWLALISDMERTNPLTMTKWLSPYIWSSRNTSLYHIIMAMHSYLIMWENISQSYQNGPQS